MSQLDLFDGEALARDSDPSTSHAAAQSDMTRMERNVYAAILSFGPAGCISDQVLALFPEQQQSVCPRYKHLVRKGLVFIPTTATGAQITRRAKSGKQQRVMVAKAAWVTA